MNSNADIILNALEEAMKGHPLPPSKCGCEVCNLWLKTIEEAK